MPRDEFEVSASRSGDGGIRVVLDGYLDSSNVDVLREFIASDLDDIAGCRVVVDVSGLKYISSVGLSALTLIARAVGKDGSMSMAGARGLVREVLEVTGFQEAPSEARMVASLTFAADPALIPLILQTLDELAEQHGVSEEDSLRLKLGLEEILLSVFSYGYNHDASRSVDIVVSVDDSFFEAVVHDKGIPYDYEVLRTSDSSDSANILTGMVSGPVIRSLGRNGREQSLRFARTAPEGESAGGSDEAAPPDLTGIEVHPMDPAEGMQVAQCLYDEFGYTYLNDIVYYPEKFAAAVAAGELASFTATARDGEVAAHVALVGTPFFPGTAELAMGVVKKRYRKASLMSRLTDAALEHARSSGLSSVYCHPVGYHTYTQRISEATGMMPCAVCFNYANSDLCNSYQSKVRRQHVFCATLMLSDTPRTLYCPEDARDVVDIVVRNCGLDREIAEGSRPAPGSYTDAVSEVHDVLRSSTIVIDAVGEDVAERLAEEHRASKLEMVELINLYINLQDPAAPEAYRAAVSLGYFVTGMFPASSRSDYLLMQNPFYGGIDYDTFSTTDGFQELLDAVRAHDPEGYR